MLLFALISGTSAGVLKTVPKYCTAIIMKSYMDKYLEPVPVDEYGRTTKLDELIRSAKKSIAAGVAGAILTNPLDVLRNE